MVMAFARHDTFYFREGWITKGLEKIQQQPDVFMQKDSMEQLGIGNNMVKALRYWLLATNLTTETTGGKKEQHLTPMGSLIYEYDKYLEEEFTLWLVHYGLVSNKELATSWYWFFNIFNHKEFDEELFLTELENWVRLTEKKEFSRGSLKKDYDCLINSYCINKGYGFNPEDNLMCPLQELGIIEQMDLKRKKYRITKRDVTHIPLELYMFVILNLIGDSDRNISIDDLLFAPKSIGRIFAIGLSELVQILELLQANNYLILSKTAGLNNVTVKTEKKALDVIRDYYLNLIRG